MLNQFTISAPRSIPHTGLVTSALTLGCWQFGGDYFHKNQPRQDSIRSIHRAIRMGINHFDTAPVYGNGTSEQLTGQQLKRFFASGLNRSDIIISTKAIMDEPDRMESSLRKSLRRLCVDYADIFYIHWPREGTDIPALGKHLARLRDSGLFRELGVSNASRRLIESLQVHIPVRAVQEGMNLLWRKPLADLLPYCRENGIAFFCYSPLAQGLLAGKLRTADPGNDGSHSSGNPGSSVPGIDSSSVSRNDSSSVPRNDSSSVPRNYCSSIPDNSTLRRKLVFFRDDVHPLVQEILADLDRLAHDSGFPPERIALAWLLAQDGITSVIHGVSSPEQLIHPDELTIPESIIDRAEEISRKADCIASRFPNIFNHTGFTKPIHRN